MAWVPGGNVIANVIGLPCAFAASAIGLSAFGSAPTFPFSSALREIACPLRLSIHGMTSGFLGEPSRPRVDAIGIPKSMCVAWMSPFKSESRIAAQLAPFTTVELIPYFAKRPFSWAMTMGEQSVRAIIPKRRSATSGPSPLLRLGAAAASFAGASDLQPVSRDAEATAAAP